MESTRRQAEGGTCREGRERDEKFSTGRKDKRKAVGMKDKRRNGNGNKLWI